MREKHDFFEELGNAGIKVNERQKKAIRDKLNSILTYEPRIGVFGKTGVGKSSLCNALFGKNICPISDVEACTRDTKDVILDIDGGKGIKLIDVPGVGESSQRDMEYGELYAKLLPELDLVLWLIKADDRAMASDETFYKEIVKPHIDQDMPFFFVLNQVDKIEPFREWNEEKHEPGSKQYQNIHRKADDVAAFFGVASSIIIPVSANEKYNLTRLVDEIIFALPKEKKITIFKQVGEEFRSQAAGDDVRRSFLAVVNETVCKVIDKAGDVVCDLLDSAAEKVIEWFDSLPIIGSGSGHGSGCYITTAVCEFYGKADDCYELTQFRKFRDTWLMDQEDGEALIHKYYETAPTVVEVLKCNENRELIYKKLYSDYLSPCLQFIEEEKYESCKELYTEMVNHLCEEYYICH